METITTFESEILPEAVMLEASQLLTQLAQNENYISILETAFGTNLNLEEAEALRQQWLDGSFLDEVDVSLSSSLEGAMGAYAAATNTIYLSSDFLANGTLPEITAVFLEEYGHAVDARLNSTDTVGDEGAIFSALVRGETLNDRQLQALRTEDDTTEIVVDGEVVSVEQAIFNVTTLNDTGTGSLREAIILANGNGEADTITFDSTLSGTINLTAGELAITEAVTITGPGADQLTIDAGGSSRVFNVDDSSAYNAINVSISDVTITGGSTIDGAGIFNEENLAITNSVISGNTANRWGGGIYNATNSGSYAGTLTLVNSTISGNDASYLGGGIYNANIATVTNSTIAQNYTQYEGGGLFNNGEATLTQATVAQNYAFLYGGGIYNNYQSQLTLSNSIIAGNTNSDLFGSNLSEDVITEGNNLVQDGSITGVITGDPIFDPAGLQNNGGSTLTFALQSGSPAIDAGDNLEIPEDTSDEDGDGDTGEDISFDQRGTGFDRVINGTVDLGAFELQDGTSGLVVDTLDDENDGIGTGGISLRDAIAEIDPGGIITFASGLADSIITLNGTELSIDKSLTIDGESNNITIDGGNSSRIFNVDDGDVNSAIDVSISDVTITNGNSGDDGGGILNRENLTVSNSTIQNSYATDIGGGVINYGKITLSNSTLSGNDANNDGGGISNESSGTAIISNSTISNNNATDDGGGLINFGDITLKFSEVTGNTASDNGAGFYNVGNAILNTSFLSGNNATNSGGGIYNSGTATLNRSTVSGNTASNDGGGLYVGSADGVLNLNNSTVSGNYAASFGGGLLISGGYGYEGIFYAARANISNSTVYGNTASSGGGGLYNYGGAATITNSTIAGNSADSATSGGGLLTGSFPSSSPYDSTTTLESAIVADNNADGSLDDIGGSVAVDATSSLVGVVSGSLGNTLNNLPLGTDPQFDPDGLKRNGGFVETIALQSGSPAIDAGSNPNNLTFDQRGLNFSRNLDGDEDETAQTDIGAVEFQNGLNTSPITVELRLFEDRGDGREDVTSSGEIFTSNFELEVLVADNQRGTTAGVVTAAYDLEFAADIVQNGDDFASITDTANPLLTSDFPLFREGTLTLDNGTGTITDLGAGAVNGEQGSAIGDGSLANLSTLSFSENPTRTASNFNFNLTLDSGQTGFADGVFADPNAINFTQDVTINDAPGEITLDIANINIAETAQAGDILVAGENITSVNDGIGGDVTFTINSPLDTDGNPLFQFLDTDGNFVSSSPTVDSEGTSESAFPIVVTPEGETVLDAETETSYQIGLTASDDFKSSAEATFNVNVENVEPSIGVSDTTITFGTPLSQFRDGASDSNLVRPAFPDIFKSLEITNTTPGAAEDPEALTINSFTINAPNVTIISGAVPGGGDLILNPGESHTVQFQYAPTAADESFDLADGFVINSDAGNNSAFNVNLIGESTFNSDIDYSGNVSPTLGAVNLDDLAVLQNTAFPSTVGEAGYDPTADINGDGEINRGELVPLNAELFQSLVNVT